MEIGDGSEIQNRFCFFDRGIPDFYAFAAFGAGQTLESLKTSSPIFLDASDQEPDWEKAKPITVQLSELPYKPNNGYEGMKRTNLSIKSLHDKYYVYFFI